MLLDITDESYNTWLKYIENAFMENNNIIIEVDTDFVKNIIESRYIDYIRNCYKIFNCFENIEVRVSKKPKEKIALTYENKTLKIKTAFEMKEFTNCISEEKFTIDETVRIELKNILDQIKTIAKTGCFSTTVLLYHKQISKEVIEKIIDILKENGYTVNLLFSLEQRKILEIRWDI